MDDESSDTDIMEESDYEPSLLACEVVTQGVTDIMIEEEDDYEDEEDEEDDYGNELAIAVSDNEGIVSSQSLIPPVPPPESGYISSEDMPMHLQDEMKNEFPVEEEDMQMNYHPTPGGDIEDEVVQHQPSETVVFIDDKKPVQMPIIPRPMSVQPLPKPEYELYAESSSEDNNNEVNAPSGMVIPPSGMVIPPSGMVIPPSGMVIPPSGMVIPPTAANVVQTEVFNNKPPPIPQSLPQYEYEDSDEDETDIKDVEEDVQTELIEHKPQSIPPPFVNANIVKSEQKSVQNVQNVQNDFKQQETFDDQISAVSTGEYNNSELNSNAERYNKAMSAEEMNNKQTTEVLMDMTVNNTGYESKQMRFSEPGSVAGENYSHYDEDHDVGTKKDRKRNYDNLHTWPMNVAVSCFLLIFWAITMMNYFSLH